MRDSALGSRVDRLAAMGSQQGTPISRPESRAKKYVANSCVNSQRQQRATRRCVSWREDFGTAQANGITARCADGGTKISSGEISCGSIVAG